MPTVNELEIQKITETLKSFSPDIEIPASVKENIQALTPLQTQNYKTMLDFSNDSQHKITQLLQNIQKESNKILELQEGIDSLRKKLMAVATPDTPLYYPDVLSRP